MYRSPEVRKCAWFNCALDGSRLSDQEFQDFWQAVNEGCAQPESEIWRLCCVDWRAEDVSKLDGNCVSKTMLRLIGEWIRGSLEEGDYGECDLDSIPPYGEQGYFWKRWGIFLTAYVEYQVCLFYASRYQNIRSDQRASWKAEASKYLMSRLDTEGVTADRRQFFFGGISEYEKDARPDGVDKRRHHCHGYLAEFAGTRVVTDAELACLDNCPICC